MALFESYERRIDKINAVLNSYGIASIEEAEKITKDAGLDVYNQVKGIQPICFENACWAYIVGAAIAIKKDCRKAADAAAAIGEGLQAFCIPGSVADQRKVGLGHGNLGKMLLEEDTDCFAFLAGHESFAAAEGAIGIAEKANKVRKKPLRVILNGLGKDAAKIIARINGFTYVETEYDYYTGELKEVAKTPYSEGLRAKVNCYGANDVREGVAIMWKEGVDVSITGNSTNPTRFQHPVAGTYKKECNEAGKKYFSVASGGGVVEEQLMGIYFSSLWDQYDQNLLTKEKMIEIGRLQAPELEGEIRKLMREWVRHVDLIEENMDFMQHLHDLGFGVYILSNIPEDCYLYLKENGLFRDIDGGIFSYQERKIKPDFAIYKALLQKYELDASECLFIDDKAENIEAARTLGFYTLKCEDPYLLAKDTRELLEETD